MLVTVTNTAGVAINSLAVAEDGVATGGHRSKPLPFPFAHIGELAISGTKQLSMHPRDWRSRSVMNGSAMDAGELWQQMVQAGIVTLSVAAETGNRDQEEIYDAAV